ncbi:hypothetical protein RRG08_041063 [Elysia crispata]|uniref:Uncharacterized protein n=1 Tax=Elysia crispata TaxID=231223 RepID=A0AAE0Y9A3_9GAST|nr:hypothetical protein RRG08_041063 [Elysia crispata]
MSLSSSNETEMSRGRVMDVIRDKESSQLIQTEDAGIDDRQGKLTMTCHQTHNTSDAPYTSLLAVCLHNAIV